MLLPRPDSPRAAALYDVVVDHFRLTEPLETSYRLPFEAACIRYGHRDLGIPRDFDADVSDEVAARRGETILQASARRARRLQDRLVDAGGGELDLPDLVARCPQTPLEVSRISINDLEEAYVLMVVSGGGYSGSAIHSTAYRLFGEDWSTVDLTRPDQVSPAQLEALNQVSDGVAYYLLRHPWIEPFTVACGDFFRELFRSTSEERPAPTEKIPP